MTVVLETSRLRVRTVRSRGGLAQNCYVLVVPAAGEAALIDPGDADLAALEEALAAEGARPSSVLLTHGHFDHVGGLAAIERRWGLVAGVHAADADLVRRAPTYALTFGRARVPAAASLAPFGPGHRASVGGMEIEVVEVPGHTAGSVCYVAEGLAFSGDTLLFEAVGRTDLPGGDRDALRGSVDALLARLDPATTILPGHGRTWDVAAARGWWRGARERA